MGSCSAVTNSTWEVRRGDASVAWRRRPRHAEGLLCIHARRRLTTPSAGGWPENGGSHDSEATRNAFRVA